MTALIAQVAQQCGGTIVSGSSDNELSDNELTVLVDATHDSRQVQSGWLYCCMVGETADGHDFAAQAIAAGAGALLVERQLEFDIPQILVPDTRAATGLAAAAIHNHPSRDVIVIGVTGTNGKSSIVQLVADIFGASGQATRIVGTVKGERTTPESTDLQRLLREAADNEATEVVALEVSSHALSLGRVVGTTFAVAIFTNLGRDHLDFHGDVDEYFAAKSKLFLDGYTTTGVINRDDSFGRKLIAASTNLLETVLTYGLDDAKDLEFDGPSARFTWMAHDVVLPLAGAYNVSNSLAAAGAAVELGVDSQVVADALGSTKPVRGRFELVAGDQPFHIAVDYAHTPDALEASLAAARQVAGQHRVIVVFGCGGDRDVQKRPEMGGVAEAGADVVVVTSDNPRSESPQVIVDQVVSGFKTPTGVETELDRAIAIDRAIAQAKPGDVVLIAGKGHETTQTTGTDVVEFDDRTVALAAVAKLGAAK